MAYQNFYSNLPGVRASFRDGILSALAPTNSPNIVVIGTASKGPSYNVFGDDGTNILTTQFGSSDLIHNLSQVKQMIGGSGSVGAIKVGGTEGHLLVTKDVTGSYEKEEILRVSCLRREDGFFNKAKLILLPFESVGIVRQRVILIDENNNALFDSESILTQNVNDFEVSINNDFGIQNILYTPSVYSSDSATFGSVTCQNLLDLVFDSTLLANMPTLSGLVKGDVFAFSSNSKTSTGASIGASYSIPKISPISGANEASYNKLYAAGELLSEKLHQFTSSIFVAPKWHANIMGSDISAIDPLKADAYFYDRKSLGYMFKVMYQGKPYVFMFGRKSAVSASNVQVLNTPYVYPVKDTSAVPQNWLQFILTSENQRSLGDLLNLVEFHFHESQAANSCSEWFFNYKGKIECHIDLTTAFNVALASDVTIATPFCNVKLLSGSTLTGVAEVAIPFRASKVSGTFDLSNAISANESSIISDPFIQTPFDLTGAYVPEEVMQKLLTLPALVGNAPTVIISNSQIREVNLAHQAAQLAYKASAIYNATIAVVGLASASELGLAPQIWAGTPPTFEIDASQTVRVKTNGSGVFGNKFLYGSTNYRNKSAYGGFILTTGASLPDAEPYGIDDTDEALDAGGYPIDIGRNLIVVGANANVSVDLQGNQNSVAGIPVNSSSIITVSGLSLASTIAAKIFSSPENREPIGPYNGSLQNIQGVTNFTPAMLNTFAIGRICMVDAVTRSISSIKTAALPTSDFTRLSTIRVANRLLRNVREIGLKYIGNTFGPAMQSLQSEIDGYLVSEIRMNMVQGNPPPSAQVYASKLDQVAGKVNIRLRFTPPFALESIQVDMAVQPPANL